MKPIHSTTVPLHDMMLSIEQLLANDEAQKALDRLKSANRNDPVVRNARSVCMMHLGQFEDALAELSPLVLAGSPPACNPNAPAVYRANFIALIALRGDPLQALSILHDMPDKEHPLLKQLGEGLRAWRRSVPIWQWPLLVVGVYPWVPLRLGFVPGWLRPASDAPLSNADAPAAIAPPTPVIATARR